MAAPTGPPIRLQNRGSRVVLPVGAVPSSTDLQPRYVAPLEGFSASGPALLVASETPAGVPVPSGQPHPLPAALDDALRDLQQVSGCLNLSQLYHYLRCSEKHAHQAAVAAARALSELHRATSQLRQGAENKR